MRRARVPRLRAVALAACVLASAAAHAQAPVPADAVVITAGGTEARVFDTPYAVGVVDADALRGAGPLVNLSEAMARVPGLVVANRSNYAQDLQINSRGFGARSTFGVRGIRLYADGIPASGPDGQGQVSHFDLAGAQRVEVLRGPFSALYGNSSGGVISMVSRAPTERRWFVAGDGGSHGLWQGRIGVEAPLGNGLSIRASASRFEIDGFRPQSSAERTLANVRLGWEGERDRVVVVLNSLDQPALDPQGMTPDQFRADPDGPADPAFPAYVYNTRKNTRQDQAGVSWRHRFADAGALRESQVAAYTGRRSVMQWQSIGFAFQGASTHPGGVIDFDRAYTGVDARLVWRWSLDAGRSLQVVAGASHDRTEEDRRGWQNFTGSTATGDLVLGVTGPLRRDETNRVRTTDAYAQAELDLARDWSATAGLRSGKVRFGSADRFTAAANPAIPTDPGNGDDSGSFSAGYTNPVAALQWRATPALRVYLSAARGFESPTFNEVAYRADGQAGLNANLRPQTSRQWELGAKWRGGSGISLDVALFDVRTDDEIGVLANVGGRSSFQNVGRTKRQGAELDLRWRLAPTLRAQLAATWLDATYTESRAGSITVGRRIAGTVRESAFAELAWQPTARAEYALEGSARGSVAANDANSVLAPGYGLMAARARWQFDAGPGKLELLARLDNITDRRVVGSVIVNESLGRFFEPSPGRTWLVSARWSAAF